MVSVGVFSWALLEPAEGEYDFGWLDRVLDLLHDAGILVDLAHADRGAAGVVLARLPRVAAGHGRGRHVWGSARARRFCPSSADYRRAAVRIASALADRYADHPALALWHVHNEYGAHVGPCYCDGQHAGVPRLAARALRDARRAQRRLGHDASGASATATGRRSPRRGARRCRSTPPSSSTSGASPRPSTSSATGSSATSCASCRPDVPVTTNFMATACPHIDYWRWADEVDVVTNDHYLIAEDPENHVHLAMAADLCRGLARRPPVAAARALDRRRQLAAAQPGQGARARCAATPWPTWRAARTARCSSSGAPRAPAPRSSTRRCSRTPAPTAGSGARWSSWAPTWARWPSCRARGCAPTWRSCGTGRPGGGSSWSSGRRSTSTTRSGSARTTRRSGTGR